MTLVGVLVVVVAALAVLIGGVVIGYVVGVAAINAALDRLAQGHDDAGVKPIYSKAFVERTRGSRHRG